MSSWQALLNKCSWISFKCETVGVAQDGDEGDYSSLLVYKYLIDEHVDGWFGLMTFSSSPLPFYFGPLCCVCTRVPVHMPVPVLVYAEVRRGQQASLYHFFPSLPWDDLSLNLEFAVFQLGWLTSKSQQSSSLCLPPSAGVKCAIFHDNPFNVSPEGLIWPCWNPYLFPVPHT